MEFLDLCDDCMIQILEYISSFKTLSYLGLTNIEMYNIVNGKFITCKIPFILGDLLMAEHSVVNTQIKYKTDLYITEGYETIYYSGNVIILGKNKLIPSYINIVIIQHMFFDELRDMVSKNYIKHLYFDPYANFYFGDNLRKTFKNVMDETIELLNIDGSKHRLDEDIIFHNKSINKLVDELTKDYDSYKLPCQIISGRTLCKRSVIYNNILDAGCCCKDNGIHLKIEDIKNASVHNVIGMNRTFNSINKCKTKMTFPFDMKMVKKLYVMEFFNNVYQTILYYKTMIDIRNFNPPKGFEKYIFGMPDSIKTKSTSVGYANTPVGYANTNVKNKYVCDISDVSTISSRINKFLIQTGYGSLFADKFTSKHPDRWYSKNNRFISDSISVYLTGSTIMKILSKNKIKDSDIDCAVECGNVETFGKFVTSRFKKVTKLNDSHYTVNDGSIPLDIYSIGHTPINENVTKHHLPISRCFYDGLSVFGTMSFYYSLMTGKIPWIYITRFMSSKKSPKKIIKNYMSYGFDFIYREDDPMFKE